MAMIMGSLHAPLSEASHKTHDIYKGSAKYWKIKQAYMPKHLKKNYSLFSLERIHFPGWLDSLAFGQLYKLCVYVQIMILNIKF